MLLIYINKLIYILEKLNIKVKLVVDDEKMYTKIIHNIHIMQSLLAVTFLVLWTREYQYLERPGRRLVQRLCSLYSLSRIMQCL